MSNSQTKITCIQERWKTLNAGIQCIHKYANKTINSHFYKHYCFIWEEWATGNLKQISARRGPFTKNCLQPYSTVISKLFTHIRHSLSFKNLRLTSAASNYYRSTVTSSTASKCWSPQGCHSPPSVQTFLKHRQQLAMLNSRRYIGSCWLL